MQDGSSDQASRGTTSAALVNWSRLSFPRARGSTTTVVNIGASADLIYLRGTVGRTQRSTFRRVALRYWVLDLQLVCALSAAIRADMGPSRN